MARTKIPVEFSSTPGIVDNSSATAITIDSAGAATFSASVASGAITSTGTISGPTITSPYFTDGYITWNAAQINRYDAAIELQFTPTNAATLVKIGANGSNPTVFNAYNGNATFSGNVGIGTTTPGYLLTVNKDVDSFIMKVENDGNSPGTSGASYADASDGLWVDTRWNTATNTPFKVTSNSGNNPMMIIKGDGKVGIGTDSPSYKLDVRDGIVFAGRAVSDDGSISYTNTAAVFSSRGVDHDAARSNVLRLMRDGTSGVQFAGVADFDLESWESSGVTSRTAMTLKLGHGNLPDATDVMTWRSNGNVGIGTTSPANPLTVNGTASATQYNRGAVEMGTIIIHDHVLAQGNKSITAATTAWTDTGLTRTVTPQSAKSYFWVEMYHNEHINPGTPNHGGGLRILGGSTEISRGGEMEYQAGTWASGSDYRYNGNAKTWGGWYNPATASAIVFKAQAASPSFASASEGNYYYWHWHSNYIANSTGPRLRIIEFTQEI